MSKRVLFFVLIAISFTAFSCDFNSEIVTKLNKLDPKTFPTDITIKYLGKIKFEKEILVYTCENIWGESKRSTKRLIFLDKNYDFIGQYSHFNDFPIKIEENVIYFPFKQENGDKIVFTQSKPPEEVYLDGKIKIFYK